MFRPVDLPGHDQRFQHVQNDTSRLLHGCRNYDPGHPLLWTQNYSKFLLCRLERIKILLYDLRQHTSINHSFPPSFFVEFLLSFFFFFFLFPVLFRDKVTVHQVMNVDWNFSFAIWWVWFRLYMTLPLTGVKYQMCWGGKRGWSRA